MIFYYISGQGVVLMHKVNFTFTLFAFLITFFLFIDQSNDLALMNERYVVTQKNYCSLRRQLGAIKVIVYPVSSPEKGKDSPSRNITRLSSCGDNEAIL